ncbi:acyclic terpene utilization AtuA family protein [Neobacillus vireti]|uniref:acyclic terpene utilization AtuA family protein n=1 Tax=Neobacillus vireti TaxID=220686 RepID=UPI002FFF92D7
MRKIRIGSEAGYAGERIEQAIDIIKPVNLDYITFECSAERTIVLTLQQKELFHDSNIYIGRLV